MTLASRTARRDNDGGASKAPRADCVADSAGGLTFEIADPGAPGPAHLVLRLRDAEDEVRLPLTPAADGRLRAALPSSVDLSEGRWDVYAEPADGTPRRLTPGTNDLRSLVDRVPGEADDHVAVRIPYPTKHGNLSIRCWRRAPHTEAGELYVKDGELSVRGRVYGTECAPDAYAELASRDGSAPAVRADITTDRAGFGFTVALGALAPGVWDLWLRPAGEAGPRVRIARLLDDIVDRKPVFVYPKARLETERGRMAARPYYTVGNDLSVSVTAVS
ncbi:hypothetical protein [Streptomyces sp. NPDC002845]